MANSTAYFGGGMSYGFTSFGGSSYNTASSQSSWSGGGLQGEVTVGYEMPRASSMRVFVEANATVPLYNVESTRITYSSSRSTPYVITSSVSSHRYAPSLAVSVGLGWQRHRLP